MNRFCYSIAAAAGLLTMALTPAALGQSRATIVLDPGHGGFDRGGVPGQRISEKDKTLDVALRLKRVLQAAGYRVIMTRETDVFIPLGTRVSIANANRNATLVSIHFNCARRAGASGIETYYYRSDSASMAASIHRNILAGTSSDNRGIRRRGFYVLRKTRVPSVLVECGFLTNPTEGALAQSSSHRQKLAELIALGIQGKATGPTRPLVRGASSSQDVLPQPFTGGDFVRAEPRSRRRSSVRHHRKSKSSSSSHRRKKKSSSSTKTASKKKTEAKKSED